MASSLVQAWEQTRSYHAAALLGRGAVALEIADQPPNTILLVTPARPDRPARWRPT
jgi:hypothetical protein